MIGDNIAERLLDFSLGTIRVVAESAQTPVGKHISRQLGRHSLFPVSSFLFVFAVSDSHVTWLSRHGLLATGSYSVTSR